MKTCIVQNKKTLPDILALNEKFCPFIFHDEPKDVGWRPVHLEENEIIKLCDNIDLVNKICITDGSWLIKTTRLKQEKNEKIIPLIIQNKNYVYPFTQKKDILHFYKEKKYDIFALEIEKAIFAGEVSIFENYFAAVAYIFGCKNLKKGQERLVTLLSTHKIFAEGWCMLGDVLSMQGNWHDALKAYEKAIEYGSERNIYDEYPIWLSKYDNYPKDKISQIKIHLSAVQVGLRNSL